MGLCGDSGPEDNVSDNEEHIGMIFLTIVLPRGSHARYDFYLLNKKSSLGNGSRDGA